MAVTEDQLLVSVKIDSTGAVKSVKTAKKSMKSLDKEIDNLAGGVGGLEGVFNSFGGRVVVTNQAMDLFKKTMRGVSIVTQAAVQPFSEFEQALVGVQKTTDLSDLQIANFGDEIQKMSEEIPVAADELSGLSAVAGQLGVRGTDNLLNFTDTMAKMSVASDLVGEEGSKAMVRILNATNESIESIDEFASVIVELGNNVAASESEIVRVATEVARSAGVFRVSSAEAAGLAAAMREVGIQAQLGGSVVGRSLRAIDKSIREGGDAMEFLIELTGMTGDQLRKTFKDNAADVFTAFVRGLQKAKAQNVAVSDSLERFGLNGDEVNKVLPPLVENAEKLASRLEMAREEMKDANALSEEAQRAFDTLGSEIIKTRNSVRNLATDIGAFLAPAIRDMMKDIRESTDGIRKFGDALSEVDWAEIARSVAIVTGAFAGLIALILGVQFASAINAVGGLASAIELMGGKRRALQELVTALTGITKVNLAGIVTAGLKFVLVGGAIAAAAAAIDIFFRNTDKLGQLLDTIGGSMLAFWQRIGRGITSIAAYVLSTVIDFLNKVPESMRAALGIDDIVSTAQQSLNSLNETIDELNDGIEETTEGLKIASEGIDWGWTGQLIKFFDTLTDVGKEAAGSAEDTSDATKDAAKSTQDLISAIDPKDIARVTSAILDLRIQTAQLNEDQELLLRLQAERSLMNIDALEEELKLTKQLTEQMQLYLDQARQAIKERLEIELKEVPITFGDLFDKWNEVFSRESFEALVDIFDKVFAPLHPDNIGKTWENVAQSLHDAVMKPGETLLKGWQFAAEGINKLVGQLREVTVEDAADAMAAAFDPAQVNAWVDSVESLIELPGELIKAWANLRRVLERFIAEFPNALRGLLDQMGPIVMEIASLLPELATSIVEAVPEFFAEWFQHFPKVVAKVFQMLPAVFENLLDKADEITLALVEGFIGSSGEIVAAFIDEFFIKGGAERIIGAILRSIPKIAIALVDGIILGLRRALGAISDAIFGDFEIPDVITELPEKVQETIDNITGAASEVFRVTDLAAEARGLAVADDIRNAIDSSLTNFRSIVLDLWGQFEDFVKAAFQSVINFFKDLGYWINMAWLDIISFFSNLGSQIVGAFADVFAFFANVGEMIWEGLKTAITNGYESIFEVGKWIWDGAISLINETSDMFLALGEKIWTGFKEVISFEFWTKLGERVWDGMKNSIDESYKFIREIGNTMFKGLRNAIVDAPEFFKDIGEKIFRGLRDTIGDLGKKLFDLGKKVVDGIIQGLRDAINELKDIFREAANAATDVMGGGGVGGAVQEGVDWAKKRLGIGHEGGLVQRFQTGGLVKGVPAILEPGEFVIKRNAVESIGLEPLAQINAGRMPAEAGETNIDVKLNINTTQPIDESFVRNRLMPAIKAELKKESLRGRYLLAAGGVRS